MYIETHCHLDYLRANTLDELRVLARNAGIQKIITIGVAPENLDKAKEISDQFEEIFYTQGIHPHDSKLATDIEFNKIRNRSKESKMVAVGEIGLDYHYNNSPPEIQRKIFEKQLQIAIDEDLPVVIHTREAEEDTQSIIRNFSPQLKRKGVIHSFTSSIKLAEFVLQEGFWIGFNGIITFKKAENVQEAVKITPIDKILIETDAPFLTPVPHRGKENAPHYLPFIAEKISEIKKMGLEELNSQIFKNSLKCFHKM